MCTSTCIYVPSLQIPRQTHQWCRLGFVEEGKGEGEAEAERTRRVGALPVVYMLICQVSSATRICIPVCFHVENLCTRLRDL